MYKHEILNGLKKLLKNLNKHYKTFKKQKGQLHKKTLLYIEILIKEHKDIYSSILSSPEIHIGHAGELYSGGIFDTTLQPFKQHKEKADFSQFRPPFEITVYTFDGIERRTCFVVRNYKKFVMVRELTGNYTNGKIDKDGIWQLFPGIIVYKIDKDLVSDHKIYNINNIDEISDFTKNAYKKYIENGNTMSIEEMASGFFAKSEDGDNFVYTDSISSFFAMTSCDHLFDEEIKNQIRLQSTDLANLLIASALLSCKNITLSKQPTSSTERERKRARLRSEFAPFEYHILEINPLSAKTRNDTDENDPTGIKHRMHLCRGHFSVYTEEMPLFGKYVGRYWIPAHVRGNTDLGIINKDYRVNMLMR